MIQLTGQFVPVKLNAEKDGKAAKDKYHVQGYPTILFINAAGEVVDARSDSDWLHRRATTILAERGIAEPTEEEYAEALGEACQPSAA